jgi:D-alanine-D-alanine ligase
MKNMHVLLLCGGGGSEHEVSLRSANFLEKQLGLLPGIEVTRVEMFADRWLSADGRECKLGLDKLLSFDSVARPVDYVVPCIHGYPGETGDLQSFLELAGLPYLGCDAEASKVCFNKITTKLWLTAIGIPNTPYLFLTEQGEASLIAPRYLRTTMNYSTIFKRRISTICGKVRKRLPDWPANVYILIMFIHNRTRM